MRVPITPPHLLRAPFIRWIQLVIVGASFTVLSLSCNKDDNHVTMSSSHNADYDVYYKLSSFYEKSEGQVPSHPNLMPRGGGYDAGDIIDYVEGTLNLVYCDPGLTWEDFDERTDTFTIALTNGEAEEEDVLALFDQVRDTASVHFYGIEESDKFPFLYDVINISATANLLTIAVFQQVGKVHRDPLPFGSTDYWSVFNGGGHCPPISGGSGDAESRLSDALNDYFLPYACVFYTNEDQIDESDLSNQDIAWGEFNPADPDPGDFIVDYRTFYVICDHTTSECDDLTENGVFCLSPDEMNYYFQSLLAILYDYSSSANLNIESASIGIYPSPGPVYNIWIWTGRFSVGTQHFCAEGSEYPFALPQCC